MQNDFNLIDDPNEMIFHLLSFSYYYGDYSIPFHLMNKNSHIYLSVQKKDIAAIRQFASRNWVNIELLSEEKQVEIDSIFQKIKNEYGEQIKAELSPLPKNLLAELGERAIKFGHFRDAHSTYTTLQELDKKVNELIVNAMNILKSREITNSDSSTQEEIETAIQNAAILIYQAVKLKNPLGNQFQKLGQKFHYEDSESLRKFNKYIENNLLKEIIDFGIIYLIDNQSISEKVVNALSSGKIRKLFLKHLAIRYSGGEKRYAVFIENYRNAQKAFQTAKSEIDFIQLQKTLLGRGTGDNVHYQFLRELSLEHPISAILVKKAISPMGDTIIAPLFVKSGESMVEFLELDQ